MTTAPTQTPAAPPRVLQLSRQALCWRNEAKRFALAILGRLDTIVFMPFQIRTTRHFSAAHQLRLYDGSLEPTHGHNWKVEITVESTELDSIGVVMDFHELERLLDAIIGPMHNRHLNEVPPFDRTNPSAENVALHIGRLLALPAGVRLVSSQVWETAENSAVYLP